MTEAGPAPEDRGRPAPPAGWRSAGRPLRVGLVGLGNVGTNHHLPAFAANGDVAQVVAIADPLAERRIAAAAGLALAPGAVFADPEALIDEAEIDVVDLATPPNVRMALARRAVGAGRAILCEKPIALAPAEAAELVESAASAGVPVAMIHNYLHLPEVVAAREAIAGGAIGVPEVAVVNALGVEDRPGSRAWRPGWRHDPSVAGGGVLMDMLHLVYVAESLLDSPFRRVSAELLVRTDQSPVEDVALCRFETDRSVALINVGWGIGPGGLTVSGPDGRVEIAYAGGGTGPFAPLEAVRVVGRTGTTDRTPLAAEPPGTINVRLAETFREVLTALAEGRTAGATGEDGVRALEATLGAYLAAATGRTVELPLPVEHPVRLRGIAGLSEVELAPWSTVARRGVFGVGGPPEDGRTART